MGLVWPTFFVKDTDSMPENIEDARLHILRSLQWQAIIGTVVFCFVLVLFREKPETPPGVAEAKTDDSLCK